MTTYTISLAPPMPERKSAREHLADYFRARLADTEARRSQPQTLDDHRALADRAEHYHQLLDLLEVTA